MSIIQVTKIEVNDQAKFDDYVSKAGPVIESYGGKFLARGGKVEDLDGVSEDCVAAVIVWPDAAALAAFVNSAERADLASLREEAGDFEVSVIEGL